MNGFMLSVAMMSLAGTAAVSAAATVSIAFAPNQTGAGGEFRATPSVGFAGRTGMFSDVLGSFQTFCIERSETVGQGNYSFTIDAGADLGGQSGGNPDPIDLKTAYLYTQFRTGGAITGFTYDYVDGSGARLNAAAILQHAIWAIEGELVDNSNPNGLNAADLATATALAGIAVPSGFVSSVMAVNLFTDSNNNGRADDGERNQSLLTIIPLPTGAAMGMASLGLLAIRRRAAR